jgi:hypothetical protein
MTWGFIISTFQQYDDQIKESDPGGHVKCKKHILDFGRKAWRPTCRPEDNISCNGGCRVRWSSLAQDWDQRAADCWSRRRQGSFGLVGP